MNCQEAQRFVQVYLDGECDEREWGPVAAHLESCADCQRQARFEERFRQHLRRELAGPPAPAALRDRVTRALGSVEAEERWSRRWLWRLIPAAAAVAILTGVVVSTQEEMTSSGGIASPGGIAEQSIEWHRLRLPMDVTGSSPEKVERFFSDKVPFAVRPPTFSSPRVQLVGARLSNLREHRAVYLSYQVEGRRVSVFIVDPRAIIDRGVAPRGAPVRHVGGREVYFQGMRGYNVALFTRGGTGYAVTSDLAPDRLVQLISHSH